MLIPFDVSKILIFAYDQPVQFNYREELCYNDLSVHRRTCLQYLDDDDDNETNKYY